MLKYNIKVAFRTIAKRKLYSLVNIFGLAVGIASFILMALYISDEVRYDRHHENADRIYRVVNVYDFQGVGENSSSSPFPVGPTLVKEYPHLIKSMVRFFNNWSSSFFFEYEEKKFKEEKFFFVDSTVFEVFDISFLRGNSQTALAEPGSVVMTESTAKRYFGDADPLGKIIRGGENFNLLVTGVIEDPVSQSHFTYDLLASFSTLSKFYGGKEPQTWIWNPCWTYLLLQEDSNPEELDRLFPIFIQKYFYDAERDNISLYLQPLKNIHLKSSLDYEIEQNGQITYVRILSVIALFILIIALINFMNLATAVAGKRAREIGMKKVAGAYKRQLIYQFITESVVLSIIGLIIALALVEIVMPYFNDFTGKNITSTYFLDPWKLIVLILFTMLMGVFSGIYPAFYLASFKPIQVLKGEPNKGESGVMARKVLVVIQFAILIILLVGTIVAFQQHKFLKDADLGFTRDNIMFVPTQQTRIPAHYAAFKSELLKSPDITNVTAVDYIIGRDHNTHEFRPEGFPGDQWQFYPALMVREGFVETFNIDIVAGRDFITGTKSDQEESILINESMVKHLGWGSNENAIGKKFRSYNGREKVTGVFKDFHGTSLHTDVTPMVISMRPDDFEKNYFTNYVAVKFRPGKLKATSSHIENVWMKFVQSKPFEYKLLSEEINEMYREEDILGRLTGIFTILVILIAALGLYGLASYTIDQRTREIGIRMVLGASLNNIFRLLLKDFNRLILIAILIAWPLAYLLVTYWLQHFAYRTPIRISVFLLAGLVAFVIALSISTFKAISSYLSKPVNALKYE